MVEIAVLSAPSPELASVTVRAAAAATAESLTAAGECSAVAAAES